jgi:hypothetical protein
MQPTAPARRSFPATSAAAVAFGLVPLFSSTYAQAMTIPTASAMGVSFKGVAASVVVVLGILAWYAFRPERLFIDRTVNEEVPVATVKPSADVVSLAQGTFHSNAHETIGTATILSLSDGRRILRFTNFSTSNGPDVRVYIVAAPDVNDEATVEDAGFIELGVMKGNKGDQNYDVPATVDLAQYRTVTIWCKRFSVNFGSAPLAFR